MTCKKTHPDDNFLDKYFNKKVVTHDPKHYKFGFEKVMKCYSSGHEYNVYEIKISFE